MSAPTVRELDDAATRTMRAVATQVELAWQQVAGEWAGLEQQLIEARRESASRART